MQALDQVENLSKTIQKNACNKKYLLKGMRDVKSVEAASTVANFVLLKVPDSAWLCKELAERRIRVRDRGMMPLLSNIIRITVGSKKSTDALISVLKRIYGTIKT